METFCTNPNASPNHKNQINYAYVRKRPRVGDGENHVVHEYAWIVEVVVIWDTQTTHVITSCFPPERTLAGCTLSRNGLWLGVCSTRMQTLHFACMMARLPTQYKCIQRSTKYGLRNAEHYIWEHVSKKLQWQTARNFRRWNQTAFAKTFGDWLKIAHERLLVFS